LGVRATEPSSQPEVHPKETNAKTKVEALLVWDPRVAGRDKAAGTTEGGGREREREIESERKE
jgi:hypothetical protein